MKTRQLHLHELATINGMRANKHVKPLMHFNVSNPPVITVGDNIIIMRQGMPVLAIVVKLTPKHGRVNTIYGELTLDYRYVAHDLNK